MLKAFAIFFLSKVFFVCREIVQLLECLVYTCAYLFTCCACLPF